LPAPPARAELTAARDGFSCNLEQEISMKAVFALTITLLIAATPPHAFSQEVANPATGPQSPAAPTNSPEDRGTTGWKGGAREPDKDATVGSGAGKKSDEELAADQPLMATGVDLNGPPTRFPPNKTPE
jgi:hypothetical protein